MKAVVSSLSEVPEALHGEYEELDGQYVLKLEGDLPGYVKAHDYRDMRSKVSKFRDGYTSLMKRAKEIAGVDEMDEDLAPLHSLIEDLKRKSEQASGAGEDDLQRKIQAAIKPLQEKLERSEAERTAATARANRATLRQTVGGELGRVGARSSALDFLLDNAERFFEVKDDAVVAKEGKLTENGDPITVKDWIGQVVKEHDYAFETSSGGGAGGSGPRNGEPSYPPGTKVLRNPSPTDLGRHAADIAAGKMKIIND